MAMWPFKKKKEHPTFKIDISNGYIESFDMNLKIRELAEQAGLVYSFDNGAPKELFVDSDADLDIVNKFAEMIVRECMSACQELASDYRKHIVGADYEEKQMYNEAIAASETIEVMIKRRFGVK